MATKAERAMSFGAIADDYDRLRPHPAPDAIDWLVPVDCKLAIDVAAGTGLFTRALLGHAERIIAVEPDDRMRAVLAQRTPGVEAIAGTGEAIPLPAATADAVFVSSAWHWLDPSSRLPRSPECSVTAVGSVSCGPAATVRSSGSVTSTEDLPRLCGTRAAEKEHRRVLAAGLAETTLFDNVATQTFGFSRRMEVVDVIEMVATYSGVITASDADRAELLESVTEKLNDRFPGEREIDVPMRTWCWREPIPR